MKGLPHTYFCSISPNDTRRAALNLLNLSGQQMSGAMVQALYDLEDLLLNDQRCSCCGGTGCGECAVGGPASGERPVLEGNEKC